MQRKHTVRSNEAQGFAIGRELVDEELVGVFGGAGSGNSPATSTAPNTNSTNTANGTPSGVAPGTLNSLGPLLTGLLQSFSGGSTDPSSGNAIGNTGSSSSLGLPLLGGL